MQTIGAFRISALLALALAVSGCGKDSTGPGLTGNFNASITGDVTQTLRGDAFFMTGTTTGEFQSGFGLFLIEGSAIGANDDFIIISREQAGRPPVGTYQIADGSTEPTAEQFVALWFPATGENVDGSFVATGGTFTITTSTNRRVAGSFSFGAIGFYETAPETELDVTITGTYDAIFADMDAAMVTRITSVTSRPAAARAGVGPSAH